MKELAHRPDTRRTALSPMGPGTLSRQLVLRVAGLVTLVSLLLGIASTVAVHHRLMNTFDSNLMASVQRAGGEVPDVDHRGGASSQPPSFQPTVGTQVGQITISHHRYINTRTGEVVAIRDARRWDDDSHPASVPAVVQDELLQAPQGRPTTVTLDGLGSYRVMSTGTGTDLQLVAQPLSTVNHTLRQLMLTLAGLTALALVTSVVVAQALVRNALAPLSRLAATATDVSTLALDRGEVTLPVRVPGADADPDNEVGRVGHAFNHMLNNVEGALAARQQSETKVRQFVADASHELRNPLAAIRGYSELTRRSRDQLPPDTAHAMARIESESERMSALVEDMLLLARLDNDPTLDLADVDVVEVVLNAVSDAQVAGPGHDWSVELPEHPVVARADALKLHQVVANLLANARKHTPDGTHVVTGVDVDGGSCRITVTDDGPGIDPSVKDTLFERFARADTSRTASSQGSTGLGLAIVTAVMDAHGGTATVDSAPGRTTFTLRLPLA